ncbi:hypothetical protein WMF45_03930 [Sorangium sp. So ce448]|uniref:hypothetical protein n=1 Tax=Sorangium sp. So ce448 TaxID=3133314 RepID=UPI003F5E0062
MGTKDRVEDCMTSWTTLRSVSTWLASYPARLRFVHTRCFTSSVSETVYEQLKSEMLRGRRAG